MDKTFAVGTSKDMDNISNNLCFFLTVEIWFLKEAIQFKNDLIKSLLLSKSFNRNKHFPLASKKQINKLYKLQKL